MIDRTKNGRTGVSGGLRPNEERLSKREKECLEFLAKGLRYQQIAFQLGTSVRTVEKQISSARIKLNAATIPHAIAIAVEKCLVCV